MVINLPLFAQDYEPGQLFVYVQDPNAIPRIETDGVKIIVSCPIQAIETLYTQYEVTYFERAFSEVDSINLTEKYNLERVYLLICNGNVSALKEILQNEYISYYDYVELVPHYELIHTPNDYHLLDGTLGPNYALDIINAEDAWNITTGITSSIVGIIDNGFQITHEELVGKYTNVDNNVNPSPWHGTFVAGIVGANTNNNVGISSIGYNCTLSLDGSLGMLMGNPWGRIIDMSNQGIKVINCSWGSCLSSRAHQDIINLVFDNGTLIIAGAGNGRDVNGNCQAGGCGSECNGYLFPASYDRVISVSSVGSDLSHISNYNGSIHTHNDKVDLCAAGYRVISLGLNDSYIKSCGTSFAGPYVSGVAGLIYSVNPQFTPEVVSHILKSTTQDIYPYNAQFTGLLGTGLLDANGAVLKAQQISNLVASNYNVYNGENLLWDDSDKKRVNQYIHIYPGGTLTIRGEVYFNSNAVIVVEPGAKLYVNGGFLVSYTTQSWKGIEVMGNTNMTQELANQGYLKVYNNSYISNASLAILVGARYSGIISNTSGGGIIEVENSSLVNSKQTIYFTPYTRGTPPLTLYNKSYIKNCDFIWDKALDERLVFITLNGVQIGDIAGNRFKNMTGNDEMVSADNGIGILSNYSSFIVKRYTSGSSNYDSYFYNLYYGIQSNATTSGQAFSVTNAWFDKVFYGIYASGSNNLNISDNTFNPFNYPDLPIFSTLAYGLYLNNCSGYTVRNNNFNNWLNSMAIKKVAGIIVNNSGSAYNLINDNFFENLKIGILAQNQNRGSLLAYTGLVLKCNYFDHNKNDIAVTGDSNGPSYGIGYYQGTNQGSSYSAGNMFGHYGPAGPNSTSDYHNELQNILYFYHSNTTQYPNSIPIYYTSNTISLLASTFPYIEGTSCTIDLPENKEELKMVIQQNEIESDLIEGNLNTLVDNGNTEILESTVITSLPEQSGEVYQELMSTGSFLSKDVLKASIYKDDVLNNTMIRDVLVENPHGIKDQEILEDLNNRPTQMPEDLMSEIMQGLNLLSAKEQMELQIFTHELNASLAENKLISLYKKDTTIAEFDSLKDYLIDKNRHRQLALEYLYRNDANQALLTHSAINTANFSQDEINLYNRTNAYINLHVSLSSQNRRYDQLSEDEIILLNELAAGNDDVSAFSRGILTANELLDYQPPIILPTELKSSKIYSNSSNYQETGFKVYPNPANSWITVEIAIDENTSSTFEIFDITGRLVKSVEVNNNHFNVNISSLEKGAYYCKINNVEYGVKLVVQ